MLSRCVFWLSLDISRCRQFGIRSAFVLLSLTTHRYWLFTVKLSFSIDSIRVNKHSTQLILISAKMPMLKKEHVKFDICHFKHSFPIQQHKIWIFIYFIFFVCVFTYKNRNRNSIQHSFIGSYLAFKQTNMVWSIAKLAIIELISAKSSH